MQCFDVYWGGWWWVVGGGGWWVQMMPPHGGRWYVMLVMLCFTHSILSQIFLCKQEQGFYSVSSVIVIVCVVVLVMLHCYTTLQVSSNGTDDDLLLWLEVLEVLEVLDSNSVGTDWPPMIRQCPASSHCISSHLSLDGEFRSAQRPN